MEGREEKRSGSVDRKGVLAFRSMVTCKRFSFRENGDDNGVTRFCFFVCSRCTIGGGGRKKWTSGKIKTFFPLLATLVCTFSSDGCKCQVFFFPLAVDKFLQGWGGGNSKAHAERSQHSQCGADRSDKKKQTKKTPEDLVKERKEISTDKHTYYHPTLFEGTKVLRGR